MRRGHGGAVHTRVARFGRTAGAITTRRPDVHTRCNDSHTATDIGEGRESIPLVTRRHCDEVRSRGGCLLTGVDVAVSRSGGDEDPHVHERRHLTDERISLAVREKAARSKAHGDDRPLTANAQMSGFDVRECGDDVAHAAAALVIQSLQSVDICTCRDSDVHPSCSGCEGGYVVRSIRVMTEENEPAQKVPCPLSSVLVDTAP